MDPRHVADQPAGADPPLLAWLAGLTEPPVTSVITRAELLAGIIPLVNPWRCPTR